MQGVSPASPTNLGEARKGRRSRQKCNDNMDCIYRKAWFQPYATVAAPGLPLYRLRAERLRAFPSERKSRRLLSALRLNARKDSGHCRKIGIVHRLSSSGRAESEDAAWRHHPLILSVTEAELPERNARQDIHRQAAERLALMGRAVSVSQSLSGLRSSQSQPHGCF